MRRALRPVAVLLVVATTARVDPVLAIAVLLGGWVLASAKRPPWSVARLQAGRTVAERVPFGDVVEVELSLHSGRSVPWVSVTDAIPFELGSSTRWVTRLAAGETRRHRSTFVAARRGLHRIGPAVATVGDGFGSRNTQVGLVDATTLLVYPRIVSIQTLELAAGAPLPLIPTRVPLYDDPTRVVGVRDYRPGDPMRRIHWTSSAATGSLQVKQLRPAISRDVVVAVDLSRDSHPSPGRRRSAELAVTVGASIIDHLVTHRREPVGLRLGATDVPTGADSIEVVSPGRDSVRLDRMLEALARADLTPSVRDVTDPTGLGFGSSLVLITGVPARRHLLGVLRLLRLGVSVTVIATASELHRDGWEAGFREHGVSVRSVARLAEMVDL